MRSTTYAPVSVRRHFGRQVRLLMGMSILLVVTQACAAKEPSSGQLPGTGHAEGSSLAASNKPRQISPAVPEAELAELASGNSAFAFNLYAELRGQGGNLFLSPHSISSALAMTYAGARGETERQMASVLHYTLPQDRLHPAFSALDLELASRAKAIETEEGEAFKLHIINALWGQKGYSFLPTFLDLLALHYGAGMRLLDFATAPEESRQIINNWVSDETEEKIKDLVPSGVINTMTRLVLTNAIYFFADWLHPFGAGGIGPFYLLDGGQADVPMMSLREQFAYVQMDGVQVIELPYVGEKTAMVLFIPDLGQFEAFENSLTAEQAANLLLQLKVQDVVLTMPKFRFESAFDELAEVLAGMGMPDATCHGAPDFSGIDGAGALCISDVVHKALVSVTETGTEAAAATAVIMTMSMPQVDLTVDRPFLFLIRDRETGAILFLGRVLNPAG